MRHNPQSDNHIVVEGAAGVQTLEKITMTDAIYKYIKFIDRSNEAKGKTGAWVCFDSHGNVLGFIKWHSAWRQYCFFPEGQTIFSEGCFYDIINFLQMVKMYRK